MQICLNCLNKYEEGVKVCPHCDFGNWQYKPLDFCLKFGVVLKKRYKLGTVIGAGGFGITYRAVDLQTGNPVAVKEFYPAGLVSRGNDHASVQISAIGKEQAFAKGLNSFLEEAKGLAKFRGVKNIVQVYDFFEQNGTAYIVMEYLRGKSLSQYASSMGGHLDYNRTVKIMLSVLDALEVVHRAGMVHRDISPDNIFIQNDGQIKLIDFGAARESYGDEDKTLSIVLKPNYAPPEQFKKKSRQGPWTDIYALGATMYKVLTGKMPPESIGRYMEDDLVMPSLLNPTIPAYFNHIIYKSMALNIENRYHSAAELRADILNNNQRKPQNGYVGAPPQKEYEKREPNKKREGGTGNAKIYMGFALAAVGVLLIAVIIIAIVKNAEKDNPDITEATEATTEATTEAATEATTEATTEKATEAAENPSLGYFIYDFEPIIYVDEMIFEYDADEIMDAADIDYYVSEQSSDTYLAFTERKLYNTIGIRAGDTGKVAAVVVMGDEYTDEDVKATIDELNLLFGEGTVYQDLNLWESANEVVTFSQVEESICIRYMTPEYWDMIKEDK